MASEFYGGYLVVSRPQFDFNAWIPYVLVSWRERGGLQFQKFPGLKKFFFSTESEALVFGFSTARAWVDSAGARVQQVHLEGEKFSFHKVLIHRKQHSP